MRLEILKEGRKINGGSHCYELITLYICLIPELL